MQNFLLSRRFLWSLTFVTFCGQLTTLIAPAGADEPKQPADGEVKTKLEIDIDRSLAQYKVFVDDDPEPLTVLPVLTWDNPIAGTLGKFRTVLFIQDGQAKAACCIWSSANNQLYHEFGSLTRKGLRGQLNGAKKWAMDAGSVEFRPVPKCDPPAEDRRRRLLQIKKLIERFTAIETKSRKFEPTKEHLRLLTTPLYRYEKERDQIVDGAVFGFVHTTDPEALVVLEAVRSGDSARWEYTFVRRTTMPVIGKLDKEQVWSTDEAGYKSFNQIPFRQ